MATAPTTTAAAPQVPTIPEQEERLSSSSSSQPQHHVYDAPTMNLAIVIVWILPLLAIALYGRLFADVTPITIPVDRQPPVASAAAALQKKKTTTTRPPSPSTRPVLPTSWPTSYVDTLKAIHKRRRRIPGFAGDVDTMFVKSQSGTSSKEPTTTSTSTSTSSSSSSSSSSSTTTKKQKTKQPRAAGEGGGEDDSGKAQLQAQIANLRSGFQTSRDLQTGILAAEAMRYYTMQYHEGGTYEREGIQLYQELIQMAQQLRQDALANGQATRRVDMDVPDELVLEYRDKSVDGTLCGLYTAMGKTLFLASLFERAVSAYDACISDIDKLYLDARNARGSALIVLGRYAEAAQDFQLVMAKDFHRFFIDAFSGLARVLEAKEDVVNGGWDALIGPTLDLIPMFEYKHKNNKDNASQTQVAAVLARLHHVLFTYHEIKTNDYSTAFQHLEHAHKYKLSTLPPWNGATEELKVQQLQSIFQAGFWDSATKMGSATYVPIFIIGFVRSGSTLLERILDAHPDIVGMGEDSVFNGRLGDIRNAIVRASNDGQDLADVTKALADSVVNEMYRKWSIAVDTDDDNSTADSGSSDSNGETAKDDTNMKSSTPSKPKRLADKMLTNYYNVGFIEMLYPNALILHVAREPMDSIFSAFKHDFPSGTLDYTSDLDGVTDLYHAYRNVMDHWDKVLPGRITHVRYEDMVNDFEGTARAIIQATGLPWNDAVLQFHKQKHAVNTYSSTQVRKGVYKTGMQFWKRYEKELAPLVKKIGDRVDYDLKTTLAGYTPTPPPPTTTDESNKETEPIAQSRTDEL